MDASPAEVLRKWLVDQSAVVMPANAAATNWPCYVASMPEANDKAICIYNTVGILQGRIQRTGETIEAYGISIRVRAADYPTGRSQASYLNDLFDALKQEQVTFSGHVYLLHAVTRKTSIVDLGPEEGNKRERFTINYLATISELA